jgi:hypothetical protein
MLMDFEGLAAFGRNHTIKLKRAKRLTTAIAQEWSGETRPLDVPECNNAEHGTCKQRCSG